MFFMNLIYDSAQLITFPNAYITPIKINLINYKAT